MLALAGIALIFVSTSRYGVGLEGNAVSYISTARSILAGTGVATFDFNGSPLVEMPPLYPALLGGLGCVLGVDPLVSARIAGALLFGMMIYLSGMTAFRYIGSLPFALYAAALVLLSSPLIYVSVMALSEPLFICLTLLFLCLLKSYLEKADWVSLLLCSASAALASLTRYLGITLILSGIWVMIFLTRSDRRAKVYPLLLFAFVSAMPLGLWTLRNYTLSGTPFGPRTPSIFSFTDNVTLVLRGIFAWLIPVRILVPNEFIFKIVVIVITLAFGAFIAYLFRFTRKEDWLRLRADHRLWAGPLTAFLAVYTMVLIALTTATAGDRISSRFLSPLYIPAIILVLSLVYPLTKRMSRRALIARGALSLMFPLVFATAMTIFYSTHGAGGYSSVLWQESETIRYLRSHALPGRDRIITTNHFALYFLMNLRSSLVPQKTADNSPKIMHELKGLKGTWPEQSPACLIWFGDERKVPASSFTLDELKTIADIRPYQRFSDGAIYTVSRIER
jgi:4-amino-4-deoxy-L-arabinose transferase-like glycosyltransferase